MTLIRLDRFLSERGVGSRREIKGYLKDGLVQVNDHTVLSPDFKLDPDKSRVLFRGKPVSSCRFRYYMLNKPAGIITASRDKSEKTVLDLFDAEPLKDLFPVGRLDRDTEGLLLITNDGPLAHRLLSPGRHVPKTYYAELDKPADDNVIRAFAEGVDIGEKRKTLPAKLVFVEEKMASATEESGKRFLPAKRVLVTVTEGRYHQIKRMFYKEGLTVNYLKRMTFASLTLDPALKSGEYRELTKEERRLLLAKTVQMQDNSGED